jgi:uncharacterized protein YjbI with pentapeptide repeats
MWFLTNANFTLADLREANLTMPLRDDILEDIKELHQLVGDCLKDRNYPEAIQHAEALCESIIELEEFDKEFKKTAELN